MKYLVALALLATSSVAAADDNCEENITSGENSDGYYYCDWCGNGAEYGPYVRDFIPSLLDLEDAVSEATFGGPLPNIGDFFVVSYNTGASLVEIIDVDPETGAATVEEVVLCQDETPPAGNGAGGAGGGPGTSTTSSMTIFATVPIWVNGQCTNCGPMPKTKIIITNK